MPRSCLPGKHVWIEQVGFKGQTRTVCAICDKPKK